MNNLVLNYGSSTNRFQFIATDRDCRLARGAIEFVSAEAVFTLQTGNNPLKHLSEPLRDLGAALDTASAGLFRLARAELYYDYRLPIQPPRAKLLEASPRQMTYSSLRSSSSTCWRRDSAIRTTEVAAIGLG